MQLKYLPLPPSNHKTGAPIPTFAPFLLQHHQSRPSEKQFIFNKSRETKKIDSSLINAPHCLIITRNSFYHDNPNLNSVAIRMIETFLERKFIEINAHECFIFFEDF